MQKFGDLSPVIPDHMLNPEEEGSFELRKTRKKLIFNGLQLSKEDQSDTLSSATLIHPNLLRGSKD
jgi:hypothetical protein